MGCLNVMGGRGHVSIRWKKAVPEDVEQACQMFADLVKAGYAAFASKRGKKDVQIKEFDPEATEIVMVPPIAGG